VIYQDAQKDYDAVRWSTNEISAKALRTVAAHIDTRVSLGVPLLVFNPLAWARSANVTVDVQMPATTADVSVVDSRGVVLPSEVLSKDATTSMFHLLVEARDVPSLGYEVLHVVPGKKPFVSDLKVTGTTLETPRCAWWSIRRRAASRPCTTRRPGLRRWPRARAAMSWRPSRTRRRITMRGTSIPDAGSAADAHHGSGFVQVIEHGPMRASIRVARHWQNSKFVQDIVLDGRIGPGCSDERHRLA